MKLFLLILAAINLMAQPYQCSSLGEQRTLIFNVNGKTTYDMAYNVFFGLGATSVDQFFRYSSWEQVWFTGDIIDVTIQEPSVCDPITVYDRSNAAAVAQGVNLDLYTRRVYVGGLNPCYWAGSVWAFYCNGRSPGGTQYSTFWLNGLGSWNHEMGHVFGAPHVVGTDPTDAMSSSSVPFNAPHRVQFGWLTDIENVTANGTYVVAPLDVGTAYPKVLRIQTSANEWFWVSYRQWPGLSATLKVGVCIHVWTPFDSEGVHPTELIDTTPDTMGNYDAPLTDGRSFVDSAAGIAITQLGHTSEGAVVTVEFGYVPPPPPPPGGPVEISPTSATIGPKGSVQFTANQPVAWSASWGSISAGGLYRAPGANKDALVTVRATSTTDPASTAIAIVQIKRR
jgi:hypothetical protein